MTMRRSYSFNALLCLLVILLAYQPALSDFKTIKVGNFRAMVLDTGDEGEGSWGWGMSPYYFDGFSELGMFSSKATFLGCKNWTDTLGIKHDYWVSGHGQWETDRDRVVIPLRDALDVSIYMYRRYQSPTIEVDGLRLDDPFPFGESEAVNPNIPGTADIMLESWFTTNMGITVHQRVFAFSQKYHDDYQIFEWTFKNTGNVNANPVAELSDTLHNVYFFRQIRPFEEPKGWMSSYGEMPGDSLRIIYGYPARLAETEWDTFGDVDPDETGYINHPFFMGEAILHADKSLIDRNDDENQPVTTGYYDCDFDYVVWHSENLDAVAKEELYLIMQDGFSWFHEEEEDIVGAKPGHHAVRYDERGYMYPSDSDWYGWTLSGFYGIGPYTLAPNDSFTVVWAQVAGMISPEVAYDVGTAWKAGTAEPPPGMAIGDDNLPPQYQDFPELYDEDENNWAKDCWVMTGKDSLFANARAAQWAWDNSLNVPMPPPAPSIKVTSLTDRIRIEWGADIGPSYSEDAADFAGYRVYRAEGSWYTHVPEEATDLVGEWEMIFECGAGTANALTRSYDDDNSTPVGGPVRGRHYYYYVTAFDDGTENTGGVWGHAGESLESGRYLNMTNAPASLKREAGRSLKDIVVVPNPFNISAAELQFGAEDPLNQIMFYGLPFACTIKIYTESGDLVKTIDHYGSGDEPWGVLQLPASHMTTNTGQRVVSGLYIAYIEVTEDYDDPETDQRLYSKGDNTIVKFLIVR